MSKYVMRIYDVGTNEPPYVEKGKDTPECMPIVETQARDGEELLKQWNTLLVAYEGWGYTIYDNEDDRCIVGGAMDPSDDDVIMENTGLSTGDDDDNDDVEVEDYTFDVYIGSEKCGSMTYECESEEEAYQNCQDEVANALANTLPELDIPYYIEIQ